LHNGGRTLPLQINGQRPCGAVRFNDMRRYLKKVADKTLSQKLKELESDGLIKRYVYDQMPPKVEYSLTERGHSLVQVLDKLCDWGNENRPSK